MIYPNGENCANPGDKVRIKFDNKIENYRFSSSQASTCSKLELYVILRGWITLAGNNCKTPAEIGITKQGQNEVEIEIPRNGNFPNASYTLYFYEMTQTTSWLVFRTTKVNQLGSVTLNVCTTEPVVRVNESCFCPGSTISLNVENFTSDAFVLSYKDMDNHSGTVTTFQKKDYDVNTQKGTAEWVVPNNITSNLELTFRTNKDKSATVVAHICEPVLSVVPDCANNNQEFTVLIENTCPNLNYSITGNNVTTVQSTRIGTSSMSIKLRITKFDSSSGQDYKELTLKQNDVTKATFTMAKCELQVSLGSQMPQQVKAKTSCYVTLNEFDDPDPIKIWWTNGSSSRKEYKYAEYIDGHATTFKDVLSDTKFEAGKTYVLKALIYVDDVLLQDFDTEPFNVVANYKAKASGSNGTATVVTQDGVEKNDKDLECGSVVVLTATPNDCYRFQEWNDGNTENPRTVVVDRNWDLQANFIQSNPTIKAVSEDENKGKVVIFGNNNEQKSSPYTTGWCSEPIKLVATPNDCYSFDHWSDGNTQATRNFLQKEVDLVAYFRSEGESLNLVCNEVGMLRKENEDGQISLPALPKCVSGCDDIKWTISVSDQENDGRDITSTVNPIVSGNKVIGKFPFGFSYVTFTITCGTSTDNCKTKVLTIKAVDPCK